MPIKLIPRLHLLNHPLMKLQPSIWQCRPIPIFTRVFPFKLKYAAAGFSSRPSQSFHGVRRSAAAGNSSDRAKFGGAKSLVEDEAELSDWVSDFNRNSFRKPVTSDDESDGDRRRGGGRGGDRERLPLKRGRDRQLFEVRESSDGRRRPRGPSMESYPKSSRNVGRFNRESRDERDEFRSRGDGKVFRRENGDSSIGRGRSTREIDSRNQRIPGRESLGRGGRDSKSARILGRGESEEDDDDEGEMIKTSVSDLLNDEDSDDEEEVEDNSLFKKSTSTLFPSEAKVSEMDRPRNSPGSSGSYLSETR